MFHSLMLKLGLGWVGRQIREIAEGKKGPQLAAAYAWFAGKKTVTGALLAAIAVGLLSTGRVDAAGYVAMAAAVLIPVGLADAAWRSSPGSLSNERWFLFLRDKWAPIATALGTAGYYFTACAPDVAALLGHLRLTCGSALAFVTVVSAIGGWLVGAAKLAPAPTGPGLVLQVLQANETR